MPDSLLRQKVEMPSRCLWLPPGCCYVDYFIRAKRNQGCDGTQIITASHLKSPYPREGTHGAGFSQTMFTLPWIWSSSFNWHRHCNREPQPFSDGPSPLLSMQYPMRYFSLHRQHHDINHKNATTMQSTATATED